MNEQFQELCYKIFNPLLIDLYCIKLNDLIVFCYLGVGEEARKNGGGKTERSHVTCNRSSDRDRASSFKVTLVRIK